jgi:hypothetical protein
MSMATGAPISERIAAQLGVTVSTAQQKVWLARQVGLLEPVPTTEEKA